MHSGEFSSLLPLSSDVASLIVCGLAALQALICRNHGPPLPEPLDGLVARFLGSPAMHYYWPPPAGQPAPRVAHAVRDAFREPVRPAMRILLSS